jgi:hypothetical protein
MSKLAQDSLNRTYGYLICMLNGDETFRKEASDTCNNRPQLDTLLALTPVPCALNPTLTAPPGKTRLDLENGCTYQLHPGTKSTVFFKRNAEKLTVSHHSQLFLIYKPFDPFLCRYTPKTPQSDFVGMVDMGPVI